MENKRNLMLHARQTTPLDAYDLYELEHMPRTIRNVIDFETRSARAKPDRDQVVKPGAGKGKKGRYFWNTREDDNVDICGKSIDAEAEKFIEFGHDKFELSKWMSID